VVITINELQLFHQLVVETHDVHISFPETAAVVPASTFVSLTVIGPPENCTYCVVTAGPDVDIGKAPVPVVGVAMINGLLVFE
jgi:hypothetical protein